MLRKDVTFEPEFWIYCKYSLTLQTLVNYFHQLSRSRGTVVLPLPAVSGEKTCELVSDNDGDGKVKKQIVYRKLGSNPD